MDEIYKEHSKTVYRYLLSLTHDDDIAEELTQETFYQAFKSAERFNGSCKITTWLCAIAKNSYHDYLRKHPYSEELVESIQSEATVDKDILASESRVEILKELQSLNVEMREVMYLRVFGELSFQEIGDILSKTENWARVTFYRGKEKLKRSRKNED